MEGRRVGHWQVGRRSDGVGGVASDREVQALNGLSQDMLIELDGLLERLAIDPPRGVVFRSAKASGFVAGADVRDFRGFCDSGTVQDAIARGQFVSQNLAELPCPTVASLACYYLAGRTEHALPCTYRMASHAPYTPN